MFEMPWANVAMPSVSLLPAALPTSVSPAPRNVMPAASLSAAGIVRGRVVERDRAPGIDRNRVRRGAVAVVNDRARADERRAQVIVRPSEHERRRANLVERAGAVNTPLITAPPVAVVSIVPPAIKFICRALVSVLDATRMVPSLKLI